VNFKTLNIFSPAKINLYLHVTGRRNDGYHEIDSLISFADIGDTITIEQDSEFRFIIDGPFAKAFNSKETDASPDSANITVKAAWAMARAAQKKPEFKITLTKNLPLASGIGGGSGNAAAVIRGLCDWWGVPRNETFVQKICAGLGADVPVCFAGNNTFIHGIGDVLTPAPVMPEIPIVLVNPMRACSTKNVFMNYTGGFRNQLPRPENIQTFEKLMSLLQKCNNDLYDSALQTVPEISDVLKSLHTQAGCALARMSGSGATCFGLFDNAKDAINAHENISRVYPNWWVRTGTLGRNFGL
jgi:4-diphosphocytidyl-2-C-methyl-D-erythritol kinase